MFGPSANVAGWHHDPSIPPVLHQIGPLIVQFEKDMSWDGIFIYMF